MREVLAQQDVQIQAPRLRRMADDCIELSEGAQLQARISRWRLGLEVAVGGMFVNFGIRFVADTWVSFLNDFGSSK
jgi:hypothetical protein